MEVPVALVVDCAPVVVAFAVVKVVDASLEEEDEESLDEEELELADEEVSMRMALEVELEAAEEVLVEEDLEELLLDPVPSHPPVAVIDCQLPVLSL